MTALEAIEMISKKKELENKYPAFALRTELLDVIPSFILDIELQELLSEGKIRKGETVNHVYYEKR